VKNLFLTRERTLSRKLLEAVLTWRLEARVSKRRILEAYLNVIELGDGVYGLEAGARRWFGKPAAQLDVAEAAFLAAMTPAPQSSTRRILAQGHLDAETRARVDAVLRSMWRNRFIDAERLQAAMREPLGLKLK
jgi:membrane peptidoglycan carboxypeptidase